MKRSLWWLVPCVLALAACEGSKKTVTDVPDTVTPADLPTADVPASPDVIDADRPPVDPGPPDLGPPDLGPPDLGPPDLGPPDLGPPDLGPPDLGPPDLGPQDPGPPDPCADVTENVCACTYVMENICSKALTKCDVLHLIPANWMQTCTDFLTGNDATIKKGCQTLDEANSSDPNVQLIQSMGPLALQQCVDNFECTFDNIMKVYNILQPIIGGQKLDTGSIVATVAGLCFK